MFSSVERLHTHRHKPFGPPHLFWSGIQNCITLISYWCFLAIFPSSLFLISCWEETHMSIHWQWPAYPFLKLKQTFATSAPLSNSAKILPSKRSGELSQLPKLVTSAVLFFLVWRCSNACSSCGDSSWHDSGGCCCLACKRLLQRAKRQGIKRAAVDRWTQVSWVYYNANSLPTSWHLLWVVRSLPGDQRNNVSSVNISSRSLITKSSMVYITEIEAQLIYWCEEHLRYIITCSSMSCWGFHCWSGLHRDAL